MNDIDRSGYGQVLVNFPNQLEDARRIAERLNLQQLQAHKSRFTQITYCGMGGSAIAGDFLRSLILDVSPLPIQVIRDYDLPRSVGPDTLVILSSYSGSTEETLSAANQALERNCQLITLSTGGALRERTVDRALLHIELPDGYMPRQAIAYPLLTLYRVFSELFEMGDCSAAMDECVRQVDKNTSRLQATGWCSAMLSPDRNQKPVAIYSSERLFPAALRWKGQICENAKLHAFANTVPEMNHNEIMSWETVNATSPVMTAVILEDGSEHPQVGKRMEFMRRFLRTKTDILEIRAEGKSPLARLTHLIQAGDWFSYHLAISRRIDPSPIDSIIQLKEFLTR